MGLKAVGVQVITEPKRQRDKGSWVKLCLSMRAGELQGSEMVVMSL